MSINQAIAFIKIYLKSDDSWNRPSGTACVAAAISFACHDTNIDRAEVWRRILPPKELVKWAGPPEKTRPIIMEALKNA